MNHSMTLHNLPFTLIKQGSKTIEARLLDDKRKKIQVDDEITFHEQGTDSLLKVRVMALSFYPSFLEMFQALGVDLFGFPSTMSPRNAAIHMESFYTLSEQQAHHVIGIHLQI